ncbi:MAG: 3-keto-disaccharide hydrolase [Verrucomicrobiales bacterium]
MKLMNRLAAVIAGLALSFGVSQADDAEWVSLFDGKTLDGWVQKNGKATYEVKDGTILGTSAIDSPNSFLCTTKDYGDFDLEFEVHLIDNPLNSGIMVRSQTKDGTNEGRVNGPQVEIEATGKNGAESGYIYGEAIGGWMTPDDARKPHKHFKDGEWNHYRILAQGPRIQVWINGEQVSDLTDEKVFKSHPKGFFGLQVHGVGKRGPYQVAWRNLKIKELK